jgi:hypothetical protein
MENKLEHLRKKEAEIKAALAAEKVKQWQKTQRDQARLFSIVGQALVENCAKQPESVGVMVRQILAASDLRESDRAFLTGKGWVV